MSDTAISLFAQTLPAAKTKLLIDMVNSLHVSQDHLRVQGRNEGKFFTRLWGSVTGETQKRQNSISQHQQTALENVVEVVNDLASSLTRSNLAMVQVADRLTEVELSLSQAIHVLADTRDALHTLRAEVDGHIRLIENTLAHLDLRITAKDEMELVLSRWSAGHLRHLPIASRCYVSLNELYWGTFGEFCRRHPGNNAQMMLERLQNEAIQQMQADAHAQEPGMRLPISDWLASSASDNAAADVFLEGLAYLGDGAPIDQMPMVYVCSQLPSVADTQHWPLTVPRLCHAQRLASALIREVFAPTTEGGA